MILACVKGGVSESAAAEEDNKSYAHKKPGHKPRFFALVLLALSHFLLLELEHIERVVLAIRVLQELLMRALRIKPSILDIGAQRSIMKPCRCSGFFF